MKHALDQIKELVGELQAKPLVKFSEVEAGDFLIATYKIGDEHWATLVLDYDLNDEQELDSAEAKSLTSIMSLEDDALRDLYQELKRIYE